ncbi:hypothetical protein LTR22_017365 [Elasticomyces elasticus]|nr:hypothetical protein LTR22_017365 [Elasticomyces elasticus]KAK4908883.1 hypothetical protein LTR49_022275 [Elasticomyces elasticus]KAK5753258.1 hypothetical protein LTS12_016660 [Elasticomyces elasticus]
MPLLQQSKCGSIDGRSETNGPVAHYKTISSLRSSNQVGVLSVARKARLPGLILQLDNCPFSKDQLAAEIQGIYAGLVIVDAKCVTLDAAQASTSAQLKKSQWQALIAWHRTLLYEHHDFLMATQHPSATLALKALQTKYSMPARMWKHGIHAFFAVFRHRRPAVRSDWLKRTVWAWTSTRGIFAHNNVAEIEVVVA